MVLVFDKRHCLDHVQVAAPPGCEVAARRYFGDSNRRSFVSERWQRFKPLRHNGDLTGQGITIRRCQREDAPAVLELWAQARSEHASTADRMEDVEGLLSDSPAALLVAERENEIVGALIAGWDGWRGNMYRLAVSDRHRRKGIGLALIRAGEDYLRQCGVRRVTALVAFEDGVAGEFWESAGYPLDREIGRRVRNL
jgi:ribosomal protein S18 acetylase RimI-like enzyme